MGTTTLEQLNQQTIDLTKQIFRGQIEKAITVSGTGLVGYNLEAPSKKVYPVLSPLRNRIARVTAPVGSLAANWRSITGINTANVKAAVAFGTRNASTITYTEVNRSATYKSFGLDDSVEDEAVWLARGFEDTRALSALATLQATMIEEEKLILGGNTNGSSLLGTPATPTLTKVTSGSGTWTGTVTVYCKVMALPLYGYLNSNRVDFTVTTPIDDHSAPSAEANVAAISGANAVDAVVTPVQGAFAYAWFIGTSSGNGNLKLKAITTVPGARFTDIAGASAKTVTDVGTSDTSGDANAFDGLFIQIDPPGATLTAWDTSLGTGTLYKITAGPSITGALIFDMLCSSGSAISGTALTADNAGGISEIDLVLKALWDEARIGPTLMLVNSQEALHITQKIGGSSSLAFRVMLKDGDKDVTGGIFVSSYLNKFSSSLTPGNPDAIPIQIHPYLPPGTIVLLSERLPYPNNNVANVLEMELQQEYADFEWARTQRKYEHGVYANGVLKHYFPAGCAVIRGIKNA